MTSERKSIPAFFLGGLVPKARVGDVLEALYLSEAARLEIDPLMHDEGQPVNGRISRRQPLPALVPEHPPKKLAKPRKRKTPQPGGKAFLLETITRRKSIAVHTLLRLAAKAGFSRPSIKARLVELRRTKAITLSPDRSTYTSGRPERAGKRRARAGHKQQPITVRAIILQELDKAYPGTLDNAALAKAVTKAGRRGETTSVTTNFLKGKKLIRAIPREKGNGFYYQMIRQTNQESTDAVAAT